MKIRNTFGGVGLFALSLTASALSLGQSQGQAVLGAPLDLVFQFEPDPGLDAASSCVAAEVVLGERRIDGGRVNVRPLSTRVGQPAAVRVRASVVVDEPVVVVRLSAGCDGKMSRSYTFFAELPDAVAPSAVPLDIAQLSAAPAAVAAREPQRRVRPAAAAPSASSARNNAAPTPAPAPRPRKPAPKPPAAPVVPAPSAAAPAAPSESRLRMEPLDNWLGPNAAAGAAAAGAAATRAPAAGAAAPSAPAAPAAPAAVTTPPPAPVAGAAAGSTAPAPAGAVPPDTTLAQSATPASAPDQTLLALQAEMQALRAAEARNNANLAQMRSQLEALQAEQGNDWTIPLLAALAIALLVLAWLLMRLRSLAQNPPANAWLHSVGGGVRGDDAGSMAAAYGRAAGASVPATIITPSMPGAAFAAAATEDYGQSTLHASEVHDYHPMPAHRARELVKPEDLFDVRQQAEFFTSVGEYEQAIAVLRKHIDEHQDSSPLAYLELLGLFYQLSRRSEYDALRTQFEQHFAVRVPEMAQFAQRGRSLAHHPELLARIEALWPTEQVCELLEGYLFRDAGQDGGVLFDLEAFDDLLLLQAVARTTPAAMRGLAVGRVRTTPTTAPEPDPMPTPTPPSALADVALAAAAASTGAGQVPADAPWATLERAQTAAPALVPLPPVLEPEPLSLDIPSTFEVPQGAFARSEPLSTETVDSVQPAVPSLLDIDLSDVGRFEPLDLPEVEALPFDLEEFPTRPIVGSGVDQVVGFNAADPKLPPPANLELTPWEQDDSPDSIFSAWNAARTDRVIAKPPAEDGAKDKPENGQG